MEVGVEVGNIITVLPEDAGASCRKPHFDVFTFASSVARYSRCIKSDSILVKIALQHVFVITGGECDDR